MNFYIENDFFLCIYRIENILFEWKNPVLCNRSIKVGCSNGIDNAHNKNSKYETTILTLKTAPNFSLFQTNASIDR